VEVLAQVDSTNDELMRRAKKGNTDPILLLANEQTAGKGRRGRVWHSVPGQSLTVSLGLNLNPMIWSGLSLVVGLGILRGLDPFRKMSIGLKWPNDLWVGPATGARKLGGILMESNVIGSPNFTNKQDQSRYCVIGIGININAPKDVSLKMPAIGLEDLDPGLTPQTALLRVVPEVVKYVKQFCSKGFTGFVTEFNALDILNGEAVSMSNGVQGLARGVNALGELLIQTKEGLVTISSDEVSLLSFLHQRD
jgi:BirA family biotin operon repressor/biotin-[acetyl-CoA-carboxylase] ligase